MAGALFSLCSNGEMSGSKSEYLNRNLCLFGTVSALGISVCVLTKAQRVFLSIVSI